MIALCTTCKGRLDHLKLTLPKNLADNADFADAKFIVVDYNSQDGLREYLSATFQSEIESGRLVVYSKPDEPRFRMGHAKNMAHRLGMLEGADVLVNLDADNFTGPGFAQYLSETFQSSDSNTFMFAQMYTQPGGRRPRGINGRIAVTPKGFIMAGGYDEKFAAWGHDDKDFNVRLRRLGFTSKEIESKYLDAVLHNHKVRFREYPEQIKDLNEDSNATAFEETTISNFGHFGEGTVYKNFGSEPLELGPVPTRIFGIGMHKTATTSLHAALKMLGYDSAHWISAHWAKAIWEEMMVWGRSLTLEKHYALCDLPIGILCEALDKAYPGSKFILTTRKDGKWINSVRNHWDPNVNPFRASWNTDPFSHRLHKIVYGQKGFNEEIFLERYRRHNAEVLEYFRDRPGDLLVMNMDRGAGWKELCGFLGNQIPEQPYPKKFVTAQNES